MKTCKNQRDTKKEKYTVWDSLRALSGVLIFCVFMIVCELHGVRPFLWIDTALALAGCVIFVVAMICLVVALLNGNK